MKKKIVFIQSYERFPDFRIYREVEIFKGFDVDIHVIVWQRTDDGKYIDDNTDVDLHIIKILSEHGMSGLQHLKYQPIFYKKVYALLKEIKPDLIVAHNFDTMVPSALYKLVKTVPVIYVSREPFNKVFRIKFKSVVGEWVGWLLDAILAHIASVVFAVTPKMMRMYQHMVVKAQFIPNAPLEIFYKEALEKTKRNEIVLGFIGNIRESLSIKMVWKAIQILNKKDKIRFKLLLCGVVLSGMEEVINEMQREDCDSLQLIAPVTPDKVAVLYKDVDIAFILPEGSNVKFKGYGVHVKLYESLATGTPAIINKFGENAKLLENTDCVIVLDEMKMDNLVEGIELLAADAKKRVQMGKLGKEFIKSKFNWNLFKDEYQKTVEKLL
jgi:glycosyltransferase involved in cell wall biosynthesis